jgi:hypothetical protein
VEGWICLLKTQTTSSLKKAGFGRSKIASRICSFWEIIYNDNISAVTYENVNLGNPTSNLTGADTRPRYDERNNRIDNTYTLVFS